MLDIFLPRLLQSIKNKKGKEISQKVIIIVNLYFIWLFGTFRLPLQLLILLRPSHFDTTKTPITGLNQVTVTAKKFKKMLVRKKEIIKLSLKIKIKPF